MGVIQVVWTEAAHSGQNCDQYLAAAVLSFITDVARGALQKAEIFFFFCIFCDIMLATLCLLYGVCSFLSVPAVVHCYCAFFSFLF